MIRETFRKSGMSIKQFAREAGVPYAAAWGTVNGTRDPALSTACKLRQVLGLELRPVRRRKEAQVHRGPDLQANLSEDADHHGAG